MFTTLPLISSIFVFLLGFFVWYKNRGSKINIIFSLTCLAIAVWMFGTFMMFKSGSDDQAVIFWDRIVYIGVVFIPTLMFHLSVVFTGKFKQQRRSLFMAYILSSIFLVLSRTDYFVTGVFRYKWGLHTRAALFHHIFLVFFGFYLIKFFANFYNLYKTTKSALIRNQAKYIFLAFFILTFGALGYLPAYGIGIYPVYYLLGVAFVIITAYAIVTHRLMDIKLVLRKSFVYLAPLSTILLSATAINYVFIRTLTYVPSWLNVVILILAVSSFIPLKNFYYRLANKYFFSSLYDSQQVIANLSDKLRSTLDVKKICNFISQTLINSFHAKAVGILIYDEKKGEYSVQHNNGFKIDKRKKFKGDKNLHNLFIKHSKSVVIEEIKRHAIYKQSKPIINLLINLGVEILTPLNIKNKTVGLIVLGPKESNDMYNNEDLQVLEVIGAQAAIALQNAFLYEESLKFSQKLKREVERATKDLREANIHLRQLDKAKTEFISITSHQLRTPLSGIKGYLSMLLENDFGRLNQEQRKVISDVFKNTDRLVRLVNLFLNVSRIESGRLKLEKTKFDFIELIKESIREMQTEAEKKNLKLEFIKSKKVKLAITADKDKLQDVILNLIDNAIKYTPQGKITVKVEEVGKMVRTSVKDTGVGIAPEEAHELFTKFTRGKKISQVNTTGAGLGLFIAKKIVELHKGKIWVKSEGEGKGSEFVFEIPIK